MKYWGRGVETLRAKEGIKMLAVRADMFDVQYVGLCGAAGLKE